MAADEDPPRYHWIILDPRDPQAMREVATLLDKTEAEAWAAYVAGQVAALEAFGEDLAASYELTRIIGGHPEDPDAVIQGVRWRGP